MSILLRQACQPLLDKFGLANYHIDINIHNTPEIVNECGKVLCTCYGIRFSRSTPTKAEIEYAVELLDAYLGTHRPLLGKVLLALHKLHTYPEPPKSSLKLELTATYAGLDVSMKLYPRRERWPDTYAVICWNGKKLTMNVRLDTEWEPEAINALKVPASFRKHADALLTWGRCRAKIEHQIEDLQGELNECKI